jgi:hypothetical protein
MQGIVRAWFVGLLTFGLGGSGLPAGAQAQAPAFLIGREEVWKCSAGGPRPPEDWTQPSFDDAGWKAGRAGFGYGDSDDVTVLEDMRNHYTAVYIRKSFNLERLDGVDTLYLYVRYDDGFIAYLNGKRVVSAGVREEAGGGLRVEQHEAAGYEAFEIRGAQALLKAGRNVLAIEGHNVALDSSDFSLDPFLATRKVGALAVADYLADIDELERRLLDQSSYLTRLGFDFTKALSDLRHSIHAETEPGRFLADVRKLVMQIGDSHAEVLPGAALPASGFLPVCPADTARGVAAFSINQAHLLDPGCPYLESIDGEPLERWLDAAARYVPRGSPQLIRRRSLEWLGNVELLRQELNLAASDTVTIGLRSEDGARQATQRLRVTKQGYRVAQVHLRPTRRLNGNVGYLLLPAMDDRLIEFAVGRLKSFRDTKGLIIDVRNNGGGTYGMMRGLYGFFVPDDAPPHVTNIAAYRLSVHFARDHIEYRPTYRADWPGWNDEERAAIRRALAAFQPEWQPPEGQFSDWHFMVLSRTRSGRGDASQRVPPGRPGQRLFLLRQARRRALERGLVQRGRWLPECLRQPAPRDHRGRAERGRQRRHAGF